MATSYENPGPTREEVDATGGSLLLEFGTDWCGFCQAAQPKVNQALSGFPDVRHLKVEDGPGRRLGRSFKVKLWPTLICLRDGKEIERLVRPDSPEEISKALKNIV